MMLKYIPMYPLVSTNIYTTCLFVHLDDSTNATYIFTCVIFQLININGSSSDPSKNNMQASQGFAFDLAQVNSTASFL